MASLNKKVSDLITALVSGVSKSYFGVQAGLTLYGSCSIYWGEDPDVPEDLKNVRIEYCFRTTKSQSVEFYFNIVNLDTKKYRLADVEVILNGENYKYTTGSYDIVYSDSGLMHNYKYRVDYGRRCEFTENEGVVVATKIKIEIRITVEEPEYDEDGNEIGKKVWGGTSEDPNDPSGGIPEYSFGDEGNADEKPPKPKYAVWSIKVHDKHKLLYPNPNIYIYTTNPDDFNGAYKDYIDGFGNARLTKDFPGVQMTLIENCGDHYYSFKCEVPLEVANGDLSNVHYVMSNGNISDIQATPEIPFIKVPLDDNRVIDLINDGDKIDGNLIPVGSNNSYKSFNNDFIRLGKVIRITKEDW